jgi:hypothetical protein
MTFYKIIFFFRVLKMQDFLFVGLQSMYGNRIFFYSFIKCFQILEVKTKVKQFTK